MRAYYWPSVYMSRLRVIVIWQARLYYCWVLVSVIAASHEKLATARIDEHIIESPGVHNRFHDLGDYDTTRLLSI